MSKTARENIRTLRGRAIALARDEMKRVRANAEAAIEKLDACGTLDDAGLLAADQADTQITQALAQVNRAVSFLGIAAGYRDAIREMEEER
jgi:hypothetical protein